MNAWNDYFHGPYLAARAYVFSKVFLCMVALDTWMLMIGHAGRYGVAGFNVAHFALLDRVLPVPSPGLYVAVLLLTGLLSLTLALLGVRRAPMCALFVLYSYSWSMSMLDSYQHHYFVSLVLLCMVFFPKLTLEDLTLVSPGTVSRSTRPRVTRADGLYVLASSALLALYSAWDVRQHSYVWFSVCAAALALATFMHARRTTQPRALVCGFGYPMLAVTVGVLYTFTAVAKMDAQWCEGFTLRRISSADQVFAPLLGLAQQWGMSPERFWSLASTSVIPLELLIAFGYLLAAHQDTTPRRWQRIYVTLSLLLALSLHVGAEALRLDIGWFSYYMIMLACTFLLPAPAICSLSRVVTLPAQLVAQFLEDPAQSPGSREAELWLTCAAVSGVLAAAAFLIDLPGAPGACALAALSLFGYALFARMRAGPPATTHVVRAALGLGVAAVLMWTAIALTDVRWDYYRYLGGDLQRRGEPRAALEAYLKGEHYAPKGSSRRKKIQQLQRQLGLPLSR